jgi:PTH1 family peptidyl-tRNA hydrolase
MGVGRPPSSDPDTVAAYVLARFREKPVEVDLLVEEGADAAARLVLDPG